MSREADRAYEMYWDRNEADEAGGWAAELDGMDCWDNPEAWDKLEQLEGYEDADGWEEAAAYADGLPTLEDLDIWNKLGLLDGLQERMCPLSRCAWAKDGVCVLWMEGWCPNRDGRLRAQRKQELQRAIRGCETD